MLINDKISVALKQTIYLVAAHTVIFAVYCYAHGEVDLLYAKSSFLPILLFFGLGPLAAVFFLQGPSARQWAIILIAILMAELCYNIYSRFTALSLLSYHQPELIWKIIYEASFGLVLVLEAVGLWLTIKVLKEIHTQIASRSGKSS
jgi:hypothetical protein